ncbi:MAG TPA: SMC family ATPase [Trichocoleus sp.]
MQILSVTLNNFKSHRDRHFEFQPGTNAICGENGAGKTSLLEAIAWTLFNYQGDYAKEDLIRNGSSSAQVTVAFISSRDGRTYEVQRCTQRGYTLYDPQLNERLPYTRIKDEVLPWLRQHLGVGPSTDLPQLFARTIGVPQGTFTADFLQTVENRKTVFDSILKVEEYKAAYKQMNALRRYAEDQVESIKRELAQYEEALQGWDGLQLRRQAMTQEIQDNEQRLRELEATLVTLQQERTSLLEQAQQLQALESQLQTLNTQIEGQHPIKIRLQQSLERAVQAAALCEVNRPAYEAYQAAEAHLQTVSQQQQTRQSLQVQHRKVQKQKEQQQAELTRWQVQLETLAETETKVAALQPLVDQQAQLETHLSQVQQQQQTLLQLQLQQQQRQQQLAQNAQQQADLAAKLTQLQALADLVDEIADLEGSCDRIQQQISRLAMAGQFQQELQNLVSVNQSAIQNQQQQAHTALQTLAALQASIPSLPGNAVAALKAAIESGTVLNQTLVAQLQAILQDLAQQTDIAALQKQLREHRRTLDQRYQYRGELTQVPVFQSQLDSLKQQQSQWQSELTDLETSLSQADELKAQLVALNQQIEALGNPKGQYQILMQSLQEQPRIQAAYSKAASAQQTLTAQLTHLEEQLEQFAELEQIVAQQQAIKQTHQEGHALYLQNQQMAQQQPTLAAELAAAEEAIQALQRTYAEVSSDYDNQKAAFDPAALTQMEEQYREMRSMCDRISGSLPQQQKLLAEVDQQIAALEVLAEKRGQAEQNRLQKERIRRFVNFARTAYKEAGPRITACYVQSISREADRLFRELLNRPNVALEWTGDYEIQVQEGPNKRRFMNLSGGEQMCAALAVRLALLKVLADIDIAFFDEPTTNMDRPRRESLAEAIARIKSFRQLFVISHDDTFEKVTENVIVVEREA